MRHRSTAAGTLVAVLGASALLASCAANPGTTPDGEDRPLRVAFASDLDPNDIADFEGVIASGADLSELNENSAVVAGLTNGNFDIGNIDATAAIQAVQGGVPLKIVYVSQAMPEFVLVAQADIETIADLEGATVAFHGPGSPTEILPKELVRQEDPDLEGKINWSVLPESPNRAAAMLAGQIDATALEFGDVLTLEQEGDFNILGNWGDLTGDSSEAVNTVWAVTESYLEANRDVIVEFLGHIQDSYDAFYEDQAAWTATIMEELPDANEDFIPEIYEYYSSVGMYPVSGTPPLTQEQWDGLDTFFRQLGEYAQAADPGMVDFELISEVSGG